MTTDPRLDRLLDRLGVPDPRPLALSAEVARALRDIRARRRRTVAAIAVPAVLLAAVALPAALLPRVAIPSPDGLPIGTAASTSAWTLASLNAANADRPATDLDLPEIAPAPGPFPRLTDRSLPGW